MVAEIQKQYEQLSSDLEALDEDYYPQERHRDQRVQMIDSFIHSVREKLIGYEFESDEEEIQFFKWTFPDIIALFIFYKEKSVLERIDSICTRKSRAEYRERLMKRIDDFCTEHSDMYEYYCMQKTTDDRKYFLRKTQIKNKVDSITGSDIDLHLFPIHSIKMATITAYRKLDELCGGSVNSRSTEGVISDTRNGLRWTGTKRALVELSYAIQKYVNNGEVSVRDIIEKFQTTFNVDLGNFSRTYQEVLARKKGETLFLSQLVVDLQQRIEDQERGHGDKRRFR